MKLKTTVFSKVRAKSCGITKPEPFNFVCEGTRKRKMEEPDAKFESMAETLQKFSSKTPDRFRSRPQNKGLLFAF